MQNEQDKSSSKEPIKNPNQTDKKVDFSEKGERVDSSNTPHTSQVGKAGKDTERDIINK